MAAMRLRLLFRPGEATQHSRHNITQHVSKLKLVRCGAMGCDAITTRWSLECQTDDAQAYTHTHTPTSTTRTNTSKHGAPVTAGDASVVGVHTGR